MIDKDLLLGMIEDTNMRMLLSPLVDELIFVNGQIEELKKYPFVKFNPKNPKISKITPAARLYRDMIAQEKEIIRLIISAMQKSADAEEKSPLRQYLETLVVKS